MIAALVCAMETQKRIKFMWVGNQDDPLPVEHILGPKKSVSVLGTEEEMKKIWPSIRKHFKYKNFKDWWDVVHDGPRPPYGYLVSAMTRVQDALTDARRFLRHVYSPDL